MLGSDGTFETASRFSRRIDSALRFVLFSDSTTLVCLGMAVRRRRRVVGSVVRFEWGGVVHSGGDRRGVCRYVSLGGGARDEPVAGVAADAAGDLCGDDSFSGPSACVELAVCSGVVLDSRFHGSGWSTRSMVVDIAAVDAAVGECAWRISAGVFAVGSLLAWGALDVDDYAGESP